MKNNPEQARIFVPTQMAMDYCLRTPEKRKAKALFILLHGYAESGRRIYDKLISALPEDAAVFAPNGLFAIPIKSGTKDWKLGFSWYIYDPSTREYYIDMKPALEYLRNAVHSLKLERLPVTLIGFSQGGYLAPFIAQSLEDVERVIGIGCEFLHDELGSGTEFQIDSIHGEADPVVTAQESRSQYEGMLRKGFLGGFHLLPEVGHRIDDAVRAKLAEILRANPRSR